MTSGGSGGEGAARQTVGRAVVLEIRDPDEATEWLRAQYGEHEPTYAGSRRDFRFRLASRAFDSTPGWFRFDRVQHDMGASTIVDPVPELVFSVPLRGRFLNGVGGVESSAAFLGPYWTSSTSRWADLDTITMSLELAGVRRVAAGLSGLDAAAVDFTACWPTSEAWQDVLLSAVTYTGDLLARGDEIATPLMRAEVFRHLVATLLAVFPNTTHDAAARGRDDGQPATVRRAVEFIDAHAGRDIDLAQIAEAARIGPRGLQIAFRRHRGQTPMEYLRRVRLEGAHRDLVAADPTRGVTVAGVAARWGLAQPGRFAVEYRKAYGRSPASTLRG